MRAALADVSRRLAAFRSWWQGWRNRHPRWVAQTILAALLLALAAGAGARGLAVGLPLLGRLAQGPAEQAAELRV